MHPQFVQEQMSPTARIDGEEFAFVICQHGTEQANKNLGLQFTRPFRLAFSRPGFLSFKTDGPGGELGPPSGPLVRLSGFVLGNARAVGTATAEEQLKTAWEIASKYRWDAIHVFQRDPALPGERGFEPGPTELAAAVASALPQVWQNCAGQPSPLPPINALARRGDRVLDLILVEPHQWIVGHHTASEPHECWPGGSLPVTAPADMISRAYLKMAEAVAWSQLPIRSGDAVVEIGSAPGGSCQRLLDLGLRVTGVDPAEMDPGLLERPGFEHWRGKASAMKRRQYARFRWLTADANVAPNYTLDVVEDIVTYKTSRIEGVLMTVKLSSYELLDELPAYFERIRSWGFEQVAARQLSYNRRELCIVARR